MKKSSTELRQKAAGYMLAASNASKREKAGTTTPTTPTVTKTTTITKTTVIKTTSSKKTK
jgi:hypothetical protein